MDLVSYDMSISYFFYTVRRVFVAGLSTINSREYFGQTESLVDFVVHLTREAQGQSLEWISRKSVWFARF